MAGLASTEQRCHGSSDRNGGGWDVGAGIFSHPRTFANAAEPMGAMIA